MAQARSSSFIDLRSDTVTVPSDGMRAAMAQAEVGDDVYREDATINRLQDTVAEMLGKEAALFVPSGVMGNQICIRNLTQPGDELLVHGMGHILNYEGGSAAALSGIQLVALPGANGVFSAEQVRDAVRPAAEHYPRVAAVAMENTHNRAGGTIWPLETRDAVVETARALGLAVHLDGARLWNAHVATGVPLDRYAQGVDSVSVCFSKGLGAPVGSALAGTREFVEECRRTRKRYGGAMRQVGILGEACLYALENNLERLSEDHANAALLADRLTAVDGLGVPHPVETNIVLVDVGELRLSAQQVIAALEAEGVLVGAMDGTTVRFVTHLGISEGDAAHAADVAARALEELASKAVDG